MADAILPQKACLTKTAYANKVVSDDLVQIAGGGYAVIDFLNQRWNAETLILSWDWNPFARNGKSFVYKNNDLK